MADLPYCNGNPAALRPVQWLLLIVAVAIAFLALIALPFPDFPLNFLPAIVFTGLPLVVLMAMTGWRPPAIFKRPTLRDLLMGLGFGLLTIVISGAIGFLLSQLMPMTANPSVSALGADTGGGLVLFLTRTFIQLIGEEVVTILPLLAVAWFCIQVLRWNGRGAVVVAVLVSTAWFASMHLPTYNWNVVQCFGIIGSARLVLTGAYLLTRNLWVSATAHIVNDWSMFLTVYGLTHLPIGVA
jgi:membrane protease YdiL (CAAX protease family)